MKLNHLAIFPRPRIAIILLALGAASSLRAETLLTWDVTGTTGTPGSLVASSAATGVSGGAASAASGTAAGNSTSPSGTWNRTYTLYADAAAAQLANSFITWTTTVSDTYTLTITGFTGLKLAKTSTAGPTSAELYYSTDGTTFTKVGGTYTVTSTLTSSAATFAPSSPIVIAGVTGGTGVTWRLVGYGGAGRMGIGNASTDDFSILGIIAGGAAKNLVWPGGSGEWTNPNAWLDGSTPTTFAANDNVTINGGAIAVSSAVSSGSVAVGGSLATTLSGSGITGTTLTKSGSGTLTLAMANTFSGGASATGGTITIAANGAVGTGSLALDGAILAATDPAVTSVANAISVGGADASISVGSGASVTFAGTISAAGTTGGPGVSKGDASTFNLLTKTGAGVATFTANVGTQMSYTTGASAGVTTPGGMQLNIASGGSVKFNASGKSMNLASGNLTDTFDTSIPPAQLTTYNGMVWDGDFYLQSGSVQINGGNIRGTGVIHVTNTGGTFAQRLNFNSPDISNNLDVAGGSTLTLSAASGASIKFNGLLTGSGTVANTGSGGAVFGNTNPSTFTGVFSVAQTAASSSGGMTLKAQTLAAATGVNFLAGQAGLPKLKIENSATSSGAVIACPITGPGELTKAYDGDVVLTAMNTFSGGLVMQDAGTVYVTNANSLGAGPLVAGSVDSRIGLHSSSTENVITITNPVNTATTNTNGTTNFNTMAFAPGTNSLGASRSIILDSVVTNVGSLKISGGGNLFVNNTANSFAGGTEIGTGAIILTNPAVLSTGPVNFGTTTNSFLRFSATNMTLTNLVTISGVSTNSTNVIKYTANFAVDSNFTATLTGGIRSKGMVGTDQKYGARVEKWGGGALVFAASNNISETITVNEGTLNLATNTAVSPATTGLRLAGGTLLLSYIGELSAGALSVEGDGFLDLGTGASRTLRFASLATTFSSGAPVFLTITNTANGSVYFPVDTSVERLQQIKSAENPAYTASVNSSGLLIFSAPKQDQTITFAAPASKTVGSPSFVLGATASSGLTVSYSSSVLAVATVSGAQVTIVGEGSTTITASQIGNDAFNAAPNVSQVLVVGAAPVGTTLASWSGNAAVTSDLVYQYAFGSPNKESAAAGMSSAVTPTQLSLTAVVRTDDTQLTITAKSATDLAGPWSAVDPTISIATSGDQAGLGTDLVRKIFTIIRDAGENRRFLKLEAIYTP